MKAHKVVLVFVDHDGIGADEAKSVLENARYPNRCMSPDVLEVQTVDIGEWDDSHPLNLADPEMKEWRKVFQPPTVSTESRERLVDAYGDAVVKFTNLSHDLPPKSALVIQALNNLTKARAALLATPDPIGDRGDLVLERDQLRARNAELEAKVDELEGLKANPHGQTDHEFRGAPGDCNYCGICAEPKASHGAKGAGSATKPEASKADPEPKISNMCEWCNGLGFAPSSQDPAQKECAPCLGTGRIYGKYSEIRKDQGLDAPQAGDRE